MRAELKLYLNLIETHYKVKPIIYSYVDFYERYLGKDFDDYPLWIAHYLQKERPRIKRNWVFWQFNEGGRVNGILHNTDFQCFQRRLRCFSGAINTAMSDSDVVNGE
jgi:lysozyme